MLGVCIGNPQSPTDITPSNNKIVCEPLSTTLSVSGLGIVYWYSSPTSTVALASGFSFTTPGLSLGNYTYYAAANTCTTSISRTAITVTVDACLGVTNLTNPKSTTLVYPNPFQNKIFIDSDEYTVDKVTIINAVGEIILEQNNYIKSQSLDLTILPAGIYFLRPGHSNEQKTIKIIKE